HAAGIDLVTGHAHHERTVRAVQIRVLGQLQPDGWSVRQSRGFDFNTKPARLDHAGRGRNERFGVLARAARADDVHHRGMSGDSPSPVRVSQMPPASPKRLEHARIGTLELQLKGVPRFHFKQRPASEHIALTLPDNAPKKLLLVLPLAGNADHYLGMCLALAHPILAHVARRSARTIADYRQKATHAAGDVPEARDRQHIASGTRTDFR